MACVNCCWRSHVRPGIHNNHNYTILLVSCSMVRDNQKHISVRNIKICRDRQKTRFIRPRVISHKMTDNDRKSSWRFLFKLTHPNSRVNRVRENESFTVHSKTVLFTLTFCHLNTSVLCYPVKGCTAFLHPMYLQWIEYKCIPI